MFFYFVSTNICWIKIQNSKFLDLLFRLQFTAGYFSRATTEKAPQVFSASLPLQTHLLITHFISLIDWNKISFSLGAVKTHSWMNPISLPCPPPSPGARARPVFYWPQRGGSLQP